MDWFNVLEIGFGIALGGSILIVMVIGLMVWGEI